MFEALVPDLFGSAPGLLGSAPDLLGSAPDLRGPRTPIGPSPSGA
jgi:hypothetical protein